MPEIELNGTSIYYEDTGDGHPFVFIHGGGLESGSWHSQKAFFSKRYRVITYDIRGHGRTEVPDISYSMDDYVEDLRQLLDHLAIQRTYLAGLSMGGYIALSFTLRCMGRVEALILIGSNSGAMIEATVKRSEEAAARIMSTKGTDAGLKYMRVHEATVARPDLTERLSEIRKPVLIIVGDQDTATPRYISQEMHSRIANSQMVILPNCGHACHLEQPDTFNSIVGEFLQRVEAV